ncbi:hypothetical protein HK096_011032, partial [Nowakowskiella sp. JEL0078]
MPALKVKFQDSTRVLDIENPVLWHVFAAKIRSVHNIPDASSLSVTYVDSDGD